MSYPYVSEEYDPEPPVRPSPEEIALDDKEWAEYQKHERQKRNLS